MFDLCPLCYTEAMQPDNEKNQVNTSETSENMYEPAPFEDPEAQESADNTQKPKINTEPVHWTASEYVHGEKNWLWFAIFAVVVVALIAIDLLLIKSYTFSALVVVMAAAVLVYSRRAPKEVNYTLSVDQGLYIGEKLYHFSDFKSFGLIRDNDQHSIMLIPIKRFAPGVSVYFPDEVGERIVDILGARLPMENLKLDMIDIIVRKLHL